MLVACFYWLTCIFELNFLFDRDWPGHLLLTTIKQNVIFFQAFTFHYWVLHSNTWQWIVQIAKTLWKIQGYTPNLPLKLFDKASALTWIRKMGALKNNHPVEMVHTFTPKKIYAAPNPQKIWSVVTQVDFPPLCVFQSLIHTMLVTPDKTWPQQTSTQSLQCAGRAS